MTIQEKLQLIKKLSGLTQEQLAKQLGVSFVTFNSWINGRSLPHARKQQKIDELYAKYTGTKVIPQTVLDAKKSALKKKSQEYKDIVAMITNNPDLFDQFVLSLTYNTNRIEGSTLTEDETAAILFENKALPNKSLVEQLEAKNHQSAFNFMLGWLGSRKPVNEELILRLHAILMNSIRTDAGVYRNHGVRIVGANVPTANYLKVPVLMRKLFIDIEKDKTDLIAKVADIHSRFEQIHPFSDGNGRIGRLIIQAMLLGKNYAPAMILQENKQFYMKYLNKSQQAGDASLLEDFICDAVMLGFDVVERKNT